MTLYVNTFQHGQMSTILTEFNNKADLVNYASEVLSKRDRNIVASDSISSILEKLYDCGMGYGARHHIRVLKDTAKNILKSEFCVNNTFLEV